MYTCVFIFCICKAIAAHFPTDVGAWPNKGEMHLVYAPE